MEQKPKPEIMVTGIGGVITIFGVLPILCGFLAAMVNPEYSQYITIGTGVYLFLCFGTIIAGIILVILLRYIKKQRR